MGRKQRKKKRVAKNRKTKSERSPNKKLRGSEKEFVKEIAKIFNSLPPSTPRKYAFRRTRCNLCGRMFCWVSGHKDNYCDTCHVEDSKDEPCEEGMFYTGCQLPIIERRTCLNCKRS